MLCQGKVRFARARPQAESGLNSRLGQRQTRGRVIASKKVNEVMRFSQFAIGKKERRVARDRLIQQTRGLEKIFLQQRIETCGRAKSLGSHIKIIGQTIGRGWLLDGRFFLCVELS